MDLTQHAQAYREAAVANLFYVNNMIHDVLYRFGFDDPSGNFQANNYDRGGGEGDYVRAEAQDGNGTNNANFSTPAQDGGRRACRCTCGRATSSAAQNQLVIGATTYGASWARFGPPVPQRGPARPHADLRRHGLQRDRLPGLAAGVELDRGRRRRAPPPARTCCGPRSRSR